MRSSHLWKYHRACAAAGASRGQSPYGRAHRRRWFGHLPRSNR
jgi:hypothetical protein